MDLDKRLVLIWCEWVQAFFYLGGLGGVGCALGGISKNPVSLVQWGFVVVWVD